MALNAESGGTGTLVSYLVLPVFSQTAAFPAIYPNQMERKLQNCIQICMFIKGALFNTRGVNYHWSSRMLQRKIARDNPEHPIRHGNVVKCTYSRVGYCILSLCNTQVHLEITKQVRKNSLNYYSCAKYEMYHEMYHKCSCFLPP